MIEFCFVYDVIMNWFKLFLQIASFISSKLFTLDLFFLLLKNLQYPLLVQFRFEKKKQQFRCNLSFTHKSQANTKLIRRDFRSLFTLALSATRCCLKLCVVCVFFSRLFGVRYFTLFVNTHRIHQCMGFHSSFFIVRGLLLLEFCFCYYCLAVLHTMIHLYVCTYACVYSVGVFSAYFSTLFSSVSLLNIYSLCLSILLLVDRFVFFLTLFFFTPSPAFLMACMHAYIYGYFFFSLSVVFAFISCLLRVVQVVVFRFLHPIQFCLEC